MCEICTLLSNVEARIAALERNNLLQQKLLEEIQNNSRKTIYSVKEAAAVLGKSAYTVSEWCRQGKIAASRSGTEGMYFITSEALVKFLNRKTVAA